MFSDHTSGKHNYPSVLSILNLMYIRHAEVSRHDDSIVSYNSAFDGADPLFTNFTCGACCYGKEQCRTVHCRVKKARKE